MSSYQEQAQAEMWDAIAEQGRPTIYAVVDRKTGRELGTFPTLAAAQGFRDREERRNRGKTEPWITWAHEYGRWPED